MVPKDIVDHPAVGRAAGLFGILKQTRLGKAMRAVSDNRDLAESSGIDVDRVILVVWTVGAGWPPWGDPLWPGEEVTLADRVPPAAPDVRGGDPGRPGTCLRRHGRAAWSSASMAEVSTLWIPPSSRRCALAVLIVVLLVRPQGIFGQRTGRLEVDWGHLRHGLRAGGRSAVFAIAAIGLNVHFGYTGLLNFGQVGFMMVGAYGVAITVDKLGLPIVVGDPDRPGAASCSPWCSAANAAPARRLPRHRHDRRGEILRLVIRSQAPAGLTSGCSGSSVRRRLLRPEPVRTRVAYGSVRSQFSGRQLWIIRRRWGLVVLAGLLWCGSCAAPGAGSSSPSVRTRTRPGAWARTSSPTRCRAWSSAA